MKKFFSLLLCRLFGHRFNADVIRPSALYFCARGCGCELMGRTLKDLDDLPYMSADDLDDLHREIGR